MNGNKSSGANPFWMAVLLRLEGGSAVGKTKRGKGTKWMVVVDGQGLPLGKHLHSASPSEVKLVAATLATIRVGRRHRGGHPRQSRPASSPTAATIATRCATDWRGEAIELIAPHRRNRRKPPT